MTPREIYAMPAERVDRSPSDLVGCYYNHLNGSGLTDWQLQTCIADSPRLEVRTVKYFDFDGRRYWKLATVWFDGQPVMITQNAGREGDDHAERFITDERMFHEMCSHIASMVTPDEATKLPVFDPDQDMGRTLIDFYGNSLDGHFERYNY